MKYFSTFLAGSGELVSGFLKIDVQAQIIKIYDGLVEYESKCGVERIKSLKYLNNSYLLLYTKNDNNFENFVQSVLLYVKHSGERIWDQMFETVGKNALTYRFMFYNENNSASVDKQKLQTLENFISRGQLVDRTHPKLEISAIYRSEKIGYLGIRLTYHPDYQKVLKKGELRPEISEILCRLSNPSFEDVFLDPFSGFGAIVQARQNLTKYKLIICTDIDEEKIKFLKSRFGNDGKILIRMTDAQELLGIENGTIDKIVTDPPWGNFGQYQDLENLYFGSFKQFVRVLKPNGQIILLSAADSEMNWVLQENIQLQVKNVWPVLISGRKSKIYQIVLK